MMKIGVTGGIGSGKSTVCRLFAQKGVAVYDSDAAAKRLMQQDDALRVQAEAVQRQILDAPSRAAVEALPVRSSFMLSADLAANQEPSRPAGSSTQ